MSNSTDQETTDSTQLPPPSYSVISHKASDNQVDTQSLPPRYIDVIEPQIIHINNYPGPPSTDGYTEANRNRLPINHEGSISKKMRIYLLISAILTVIFGLVPIGIEIAIIVLKIDKIYYFGFWGGGLIIVIALNTFLFSIFHVKMTYSKLSKSFFWQSGFAALLLCFSIIIVLTNKCSTAILDNPINSDLCKNSKPVLNGFLIGIFVAVILQAAINAAIFHTLKRKQSWI